MATHLGKIGEVESAKAVSDRDFLDGPEEYHGGVVTTSLLAATKHYLCCCHKVAQLRDLIHLVGAEHSGRLFASHATERALTSGALTTFTDRYTLRP